jgi:pyruvate, orthophosphate dikinase
MAEVLPEAFKQFIENVEKLEHHFKDMQDIEFTVEDGKLWMLQCRSGKRTGGAAFQIAVDMVNEKLCTPAEALLRIESDHIKQILHPTFPDEAIASDLYKSNVVAVGLAGGPGAAVGKIVLSSAAAEEAKARGESVILCTENTSPEDVGGMWAAIGVLTARGGMTSHAAVVARGWGKPCVVGCGELEINAKAGIITVKSTGEVLKEGDAISLNGSTGEVLKVAIQTSTPSLDGSLGTVLRWADEVEDSLGVYANADSGSDAAKAAELGAKGIGLCRTEHMFFAPNRLPVVRRWILRGEGLDDVQEFQRSDFKEIFAAMNNNPVTIRMLDPPLHEFLPRQEQLDEAMAMQLGYGKDVKALKEDVESLHEENPMLGCRGCRLAIVRPELTVMQVEAIIHAAADFMEEDQSTNKPRPRIMIPLVGSVAEFETQAKVVRSVAERVKKERKLDVPYEIGTMIEVPRAALISDKIASLVDEAGNQLCQFFSYGTNDLTQMTLGISRDDAGSFIPAYMEQGIYEEDPFKTIDQEGVGFLVRKSAAAGRSVKPDLSLSVCGEHGGDPKSIAFFDSVGLDYVSCSPYRVPVARLAAGQAAVKRQMSGDTSTGKERVGKLGM